MKYRKVLIKPEQNYSGRVTKYPESTSVTEHGLRWHGSYEIAYIVSGKMKLSTVDKDVYLEKNDLYILNNQEVHSYVDVGENTHAIMLNIIPGAILPYVENPHIVPSFRQPENEALKIMKIAMKRLYGYDEYKSKLISMKIRAVMYEIAYYMIRDCLDNDIKYIKGSRSEDFDCAKIAIRYMRENYKSEITLNEISRYVGMSPAHFSKYFRDKTEETFSKYLRRVRLEHAVEDLRTKKTTVKAAALENGFPNVNSFIGGCKAEYGLTPAELKNYSEKN